jgi:hypothetical protein
MAEELQRPIELRRQETARAGNIVDLPPLPVRRVN